MSIQSRRTFLKGAAAAAGFGASSAIAVSKAARRVFAAEQPPRIKYCKCNETFRDWPQEKIFKFVAQCGYRGVEIAPFTLSNYVTDVGSKERAKLRKYADEARIQIVGLHWLLAKTEGLHLTSPDPDVRHKTTEYLRELGKFCKDLGGSLLVFGSPQQRNLMPGVSRDEGMRYAAEVFRAAMPTLEKLDVMLALEPLGEGTTNFMITAADTVELAEMVDSPNCRLILDCKAMVTESTPIPELIRKHASWLVHFHANDANRQGPGMGELDFVPIFEALRDIKYRGWVSVEVFDYSPGPKALARESIQYMKKIEAKVFG
jgi:sugar phosphate isomerase/epimerase